MKQLIPYSRLLLILFALPFLNPSLKAGDSAQPIRIIKPLGCSLRLCRFQSGKRELWITPKGAILPDWFGHCPAEGFLYLKANRFLNQTLLDAKHIQLTEIGQKQELYIPLFDIRTKVQAAKVWVDGKGLSEMLFNQGLAIRDLPEYQTRKTQPRGIWCGEESISTH